MYGAKTSLSGPESQVHPLTCGYPGLALPPILYRLLDSLLIMPSSSVTPMFPQHSSIRCLLPGLLYEPVNVSPYLKSSAAPIYLSQIYKTDLRYIYGYLTRHQIFNN